MTQNLHALAYFSRSVASEFGGTYHIELGRILAAARKNNVQKGITGALIFSDHYFAQVLEGPRDELEAIFEKIECDPRHSNVTVIHFKPIKARSFSDWSMAFAEVPGPSAALLGVNDVLANPANKEAYDAGRDIQTLLLDLIDAHGGADKMSGPEVTEAAKPVPSTGRS